MGHVAIPAGAVFPGDSPTASPWVYQGNAGNADVWATDGTTAVVSWLRVLFRPGHHFTDAGVAAASGLANSYLTSVKVAAVGVGRHMAGFDAANFDFAYVDVGRRTLACTIVGADLPAQVTAVLAILSTGANVA